MTITECDRRANVNHYVVNKTKIGLTSLGQSDITAIKNAQRGSMANQLCIRKVQPQVRRWIKKQMDDRRLTQNAIVLEMLEQVAGDTQMSIFEPLHEAVAPPTTASVPFVFIDLFAGIGGFRLGLESLGGHCVFSSEWDKHAQKTYHAWFGETPEGDIRKIDLGSIPDHDILAAGFPCQPFSIAGVSKKKSLGRAHGFLDETQGTLFFHLASVIEAKRPPVAILENVKNLRSHDKGHTWEVINRTLSSLGYKVFSEVIDARYWVPQHRERVFIVCFDTRVFGQVPPFSFGPIPDDVNRKVEDILESGSHKNYVLSDKLWSYLQDYAKRHREKGNGFGYGLVDLKGVARTLSARYYKDGSEVLIPLKNGNPRRLTPREAARLMGFDDKLPIVVSDTQAYKQFGNAVVPAVVRHVGSRVLETIRWMMLSRRKECLIKNRINA